LIIILFILVFTATVFVTANIQINKASANVEALREELDKVESDELIERYNAAVRYYNVTIKMIPARFIAGAKGLAPYEMYNK
jgi:hypothetical protein